MIVVVTSLLTVAESVCIVLGASPTCAFFLTCPVGFFVTLLWLRSLVDDTGATSSTSASESSRKRSLSSSKSLLLVSLGIFLLAGASRGLSSLFSLSLLAFLAFPFPFDGFGLCFGVGVSGERGFNESLADGMRIEVLLTLRGLALPAAVRRGRPKLSDLPGKKYLRPCAADDVADGAAPINTGVFPSSIAINLSAFRLFSFKKTAYLLCQQEQHGVQFPACQMLGKDG